MIGRANVHAGLWASCLMTCGWGTPEPTVPAEPVVAIQPAATEPVDLLTRGAEFEGASVVAHVPEHPVGLVFVFHGTGAGIGYAERAATRQVLEGLQQAGYAWFATLSTEREADGRWDTSTLHPQQNRDVGRLLRLASALIDQSSLTEDLPWFTLGMSTGGSMATSFAHIAQQQGWPIVAAAAYAAPVDLAVREDGGPVVPTFVVVMAYDEIVQSPKIREGWEGVKAAGVPVEVWQAERRGVTVEELARRSGLDTSSARYVLDYLSDAEVIDADGLLVGPEDVAMEVIRNLAEANDDLSRRSIKDVFREDWALHTMTGRFAAQNVAFFERQRASYTPPAVGWRAPRPPSAPEHRPGE